MAFRARTSIWRTAGFLALAGFGAFILLVTCAFWHPLLPLPFCFAGIAAIFVFIGPYPYWVLRPAARVRGGVRWKERIQLMPLRRFYGRSIWSIAWTLLCLWTMAVIPISLWTNYIVLSRACSQGFSSAQLLPSLSPVTSVLTVAGSRPAKVTTVLSWFQSDPTLLVFMRPSVSYTASCTVAVGGNSFTSHPGERVGEFLTRAGVRDLFLSKHVLGLPLGLNPATFGLTSADDLTFGRRSVIIWDIVWYDLAIAAWLALFGLLLAALTRMFLTTRRERRRLRLRAGLCPGCRYPRTVPHTICPECGEKQSLQLPSSVRPAAPPAAAATLS